MNSEIEVDTKESGGKIDGDKAGSKTDVTGELEAACSMSKVVSSECTQVYQISGGEGQHKETQSILGNIEHSLLCLVCRRNV